MPAPRARRRPGRTLVPLVLLAAFAALAWSVAGSGSPRPSRGGGGTATSPPTSPAVTSAPSTRPGTTTSTTSDHARKAVRYAVGTDTLTVYNGTRALPTLVAYPAQRAGAQAPPLPRAGGWPLIVFSQGFAIAPQAYSDLTNAWAAAGYVVASPAYPLTSPDDAGGLDEADILNHPADLRAVVTQLLADGAANSPVTLLRGLIADRVGLAGHSDGGDVTDAAIADTCCQLTNVAAAVILSGAELASFGGTYSTPDVPLLVVQGDQDTINPPACSQQIYNGAGGPRYYLDLLGAGHHEPYIDPSALTLYSDPNEGKAAAYRRVVVRTTIAFWDRYLSGATSSGGPEHGGNVSGVSSLTAQVPVAQEGTCPGAPAG